MKDIFGAPGKLKSKNLGCGAIALLFFTAIIIIVGFFMFAGWVFQMVWNSALVPTFDLPYLQYWASVGIVWLIHFIGGCFIRGESKWKE